MSKTAAAKEAPKPAAPTRKIQAPNGARMKEASFVRALYVLNADDGAQPEDLQSPEFWAHVASTLKNFDRIEVRAADGTWLAECLVLEVARGWARVHVLQVYRLTAEDVAQTSGALASLEHEVRWRGPAAKWSVIRKADGAILHEGDENRDTANAWLVEHLKAHK